MTGATALRVLIVDDQAVVRLGFTSLLDSQPDLTVVGVAGDGREAVRLAGQLAPDIVLMDIRMPILGGIDATRLLQDHPDPPKVLILTTFDLDDYVYDALRAGASGFLLKDATPEQILEAVRVLGAGDALLAPAVTRTLIGEFAGREVRQATRGSPPRGLELLSPVRQPFHLGSDWYDNPMEAVVDQAGRIVLPKYIRDALGLLPGTKVDISPYGAGVQVVPTGRTARLIEEDGALVSAGDTPVDDDVLFGLIDAGRR